MEKVEKESKKNIGDIKVELVSYTSNPVASIESAASNCYDSTPTDGSIMNSCYDSGHHSVLEFAQFQFKISGISRACSHQLVRHRTGSYAQRSQRYVEEEGVPVVIPPSLSLYKDEALKDVLDEYICAVLTCKQSYDKLVEMGVPKEDARYVLPNAWATIIEVSFDLRNLIHFCNERLCTRTQWELRWVAKEIARLVSEVEPKFKRFLVPKCEKHKDLSFCPEKKGCGKYPTLRDIADSIKYK